MIARRTPSAWPICALWWRGHPDIDVRLGHQELKPAATAVAMVPTVSPSPATAVAAYRVDPEGPFKVRSLAVNEKVEFVLRTVLIGGGATLVPTSTPMPTTACEKNAIQMSIRCFCCSGSGMSTDPTPRPMLPKTDRPRRGASHGCRPCL